MQRKSEPIGWMKVADDSSLAVECSIEADGWNSLEFDLQTYIKDVVMKTLYYIGYFTHLPNAAVSILLADSNKLQSLNKDFRQNNKATNILSFAHYAITGGEFYKYISKKDPYLGDIAISYSKIFEEAMAQEKSFKDHFSHILIHGILHLLGHDHKNSEDAHIMEGLEIIILNQFYGIRNPYI